MFVCLKRKSIKKALKILSVFILIVAGFVVLVWSAMRSPLVQTQIADRITAYLSRTLNAEVSVRKARYYINQGLTLQDLLVRCPNGDTLLFVPQLSGYLRSVNMSAHNVEISRAYMRGARVSIEKTDSTDNFSFLAGAFSRSDTVKDDWKIGIDEITVVQTLFKFNSNDKQHIFNDLNLDFSKFRLNGDSLSVQLETLSAGYNGMHFIDDMSLDFSMQDKILLLDNVKIQSQNSQMAIRHIDIDTDRNSGLSYGAVIDYLRLKPSDLEQIVPFFENKNDNISFSGEFVGTLNKVRGRNVRIQATDSTAMMFDLSVRNIRDLENFSYKLNVDKLTATSTDLLQLLKEYANVDTAQVAKYISPFTRLEFDGFAEGTLNNIGASGTFSTGLGAIKMQAAMERLAENTFNLDGHLKSTVVDLAPLTGDNVSLRLDMNATGQISGRSNTSLSLSGSVNDINYNGHGIDSISVDGMFRQRMFSGRICSFDPSLRFDFNGLVDLNSSSAYKFESSVYYANLYELGLSSNRKANLSLNMNADFRNENLDFAEGRIDLTDIYYFCDSGYFATDTVSVIAIDSDRGKIIRFQSEFVSAEVVGNYNLSKLPKSIVSFVDNRVFGSDQEPIVGNNGVNVKIVAEYPHPVTEMFAPWLNISSGTSVECSYNDSTGTLGLRLSSDNVSAKNIQIDNLAMEIHSSHDSLYADFASDVVYFSDFESMKNLKIASALNGGVADVSLVWNNFLKKGNNSGAVNAKMQLPDKDKKSDRQTLVSILPSSLTIFDTLATIKPATIIINDTSLIFNKIDIDNSTSRIYVDGILSDNPADSLDIAVNNVKLDYVSDIFSLKTRFSGLLSCKTVLKDLKGEKQIDGSVSVSDFAINGQRFGNVQANAGWDMDMRQLLISGALSDNGGQSRTGFGGYIDPSHSYMNLDAEAVHQDVQFLKLFLSNVFCELDGTFSGKMHLDGKLTSPNWYGKMGLENALLQLKPTKAKYYVTDTLEFVENKILFNNIKGTDAENGKISLNGSVWHRDMKNFNVDLKIECDNIIGLDTRYSDSPLWYGKTYCSGIVDITGSTRSTINVGISAVTKPKSMFYITMEGKNDLSENDFISFVKSDNINSTLETKKRRVEQEVITSRSVLNLNFELKVTPEAEIQIVFDPTIGDALRSSGSADLSIRLDDGKFSIYGTYLIDKGDFTFTLQNIISKKLDLQSGSYVTWTGDPLGATVNIDAAYKLRKVPVYSLTLNEEDREKKVPVNCHLIMSNKLVSPNISFSVDVPSTTTNVEEIEQLNNLPEDDLNQQVIYLLLLNKFYPLASSATASDNTSSAASAGASTASELLSNQLSKWISQVSTNFDLGVAYRPETEISSEEYELALSTTLWDDRIIVNSNFDMSNQDKASENGTTQYTTDFSVELKLNKKGNVRLKAFQKVNEDLIYDDAPYTRGLGIFFTEDFNDFGELWRRWFKRKTKANKTDGFVSEGENQ